MLYAEVQDVEAGFRALSKEEQTRCVALLSEAAVIIDHYNPDADADTKRVVSCRMVPMVKICSARAIEDIDSPSFSNKQCVG